MLLAMVVMTSHANGEERLTFVNADGSTVSFSTSGLVITYDTGDGSAHAIVVNDETSATLDVSELECMYFGEKAGFLPGDVNGDNEVSVSDVNAVIDTILRGVSLPAADVNADGEVGVSDVNAVIDIILQ